MPAPPPAHDRHCQADPRCRRTPCFQAQLHSTPDQADTSKTADTCADHLGDTVQALTRWAADNGFSSGHLQVCAIGPSPSPAVSGQESRLTVFPFASIPLQHDNPGNPHSFPGHLA